MENKKELAKSYIEYGCGHTTEGTLILDSNELSMTAYLEWSKSVGIFGDKSQCFNCWCKEMEEVKSLK